MAGLSEDQLEERRAARERSRLDQLENKRAAERERKERIRQVARERALAVREALREQGEDVEGGEDLDPGPRPKRWADLVLAKEDNVDGQIGGNPITVYELDEFLHIYAQNGVAAQAAATIGRSWAAIKKRIDEDPVLAQAFADAKQHYAETLIMEANRRGRDGIVKPIFSHASGMQIGVERVYSDRLLEVQLRAVLPGHYRDNVSVDATVRRGVLVVDKPCDTMEEWDAKYGPAAVAKRAAASEAQALPAPSDLSKEQSPSGTIGTNPGASN